MNIGSFIHSIDHLQDYFTHVGVDGKKADRLVTEELTLIEKPTCWMVRLVKKILGKIHLYPFGKTNLSRVITKIDTYTCSHSDLDNTTKEKAQFVSAALKNIQSRRDPHLATLKALNCFKYQLTSLRPLDRAPSDLQLLQEQQQAYAAGKELNTKELDTRIKAVIALPKFANVLPTEVIKRIFHYLLPQDIGPAGRTCTSWHSVVHSIHLWKKIEKGNQFLFSFLPPAESHYPHDALRNNRLQLPALVKGLRQVQEAPASLQVLGNGTAIIRGERVTDLIVYRVNTATGSYHAVVQGENCIYSCNTAPATRLYTITDTPVKHHSFYQNRFFFLLADNTVRVFDLTTRESRTLSGTVHTPNGTLSCGYYFGTTTDGQAYVQELSHLENPPKIFQDSQGLTFLAANPETVSFKKDGCIAVYYIESGQVAARFALDARRDEIRYDWADNGVLIVDVIGKGAVIFDILTQKLLAIVPIGSANHSFYLLGSKLYRYRL